MKQRDLSATITSIDGISAFNTISPTHVERFGRGRSFGVVLRVTVKVFVTTKATVTQSNHPGVH